MGSRVFIPIAWVVLVLGWVGYFVGVSVYKSLSGIEAWSEMGARGDTFGALNTLLTGCAFIGILMSYQMEKRQLRTQMEELESQRAELLENRAASAKQAFENTFFKMLQNLREIERTMASVSRSRSLIHAMSGFSMPWTDAEAKSDIGRTYRDVVYDKFEDSLGPYFRSLHHLLKFIDLSKSISQEEKYRYGNIVRAGLSKSELILIAANCCNEDLSQDFQIYLVRYRLLKHLSPPYYRTTMEGIFPIDAFNARD